MVIMSLNFDPPLGNVLHQLSQTEHHNSQLWRENKNKNFFKSWLKKTMRRSLEFGEGDKFFFFFLN